MATTIIMRALASTVYFHTGSSLMSGSFFGASGMSRSQACELPLLPPPQNRPTRWQIPDFSSSSATERKREKLVLPVSVCSFSLPVFVNVTPFLSYLHHCFYSPSSPRPLSGLFSLSPLAPSPNPSSPLWNDAG